MESNRGSDLTPADAHRALADVSQARGRLADHASNPWWFHIGLAAAFGIPIAAWSIAPPSEGLLLYVVPVILVPALVVLAGRATGVGFKVYESRSTLVPNALVLLAVLGMVVLGLLGQYALDLSWSMAAAGVAAFALLAVAGPRIEALGLRSLRENGD